MGVLPTRTVSVDRSAFAVRHFPAVWVSGLFWNLTRWGVAFLGTFLVNDLTGSPRLVQLAGAVLYAPLLFGGLAGGLLSDRLDRLRTVRVQLVTLIPISILLGLAVRAEVVAVWMVYLYMFVFGIGWVTDMTSRRALVYDLVGESRLDHAMAMEAISLSSGMILGALVGGTAVDAVGVGAAYFCIAGLLAVAVLALVGVRSPTPTRTVAAPGDSSAEVKSSARAEFGQAIELCRTQPAMLSLLGVTVIVNFFLFAYLPIVPVVAERLGAGPTRVGLLAAGTGVR